MLLGPFPNFVAKAVKAGQSNRYTYRWADKCFSFQTWCSENRQSDEGHDFTIATLNHIYLLSGEVT